jgi:hypothetical protein
MTSWVFMKVNVIQENDHTNIFAISQISDQLYIKILEYDKEGDIEEFLWNQFEEEGNSYVKAVIKVFKKVSLNDLEVLKKYHKFIGDYYSSYHNVNIFGILEKHILKVDTHKVTDSIDNIYQEILSEIDYDYLHHFIIEDFNQLIFENFENEELEDTSLQGLNLNLNKWKENLELLKHCKSDTLDPNILSLIQDYLMENKFITVKSDPVLWSHIRKELEKNGWSRGETWRSSLCFISPNDLLRQYGTYFGNISIRALIAINHPNLKPVINYMLKWNLLEVDII